MKKKFVNLLMVFVLATSITVQASEVGASPEENTLSTEQVQAGSDDYDVSEASYIVDSQEYTISAGEPNIVYSPIVLDNVCRITAGSFFVFSKSAEYQSTGFTIYFNDKAIRTVKTAYVVIKLDEVPSSISDGTIITAKTISNKPFGNGYFENGATITGYNSDSLMELPNGRYYIRAFVKDINNVYSINGGLFFGASTKDIPYFEIKD